VPSRAPGGPLSPGARSGRGAGPRPRPVPARGLRSRRRVVPAAHVRAAGDRSADGRGPVLSRRVRVSDRRPRAGGARLPPGGRPVPDERIRAARAAARGRCEPAPVAAAGARPLVRRDGTGPLPGARRALPRHGGGDPRSGARAAAPGAVRREGLQERHVLLPAPRLRFFSSFANYQGTSRVPEALMRLAESYRAIGYAEELKET